ncbi:MAG TPA: hypothetical protein VHY08_28405 [Bacillota bacterium]|nr:hypothetical protein [Bacillota bacterium]
MANANQNQLIARARAVNKTSIDQNLLSQEVTCPTKELQQATKREELQVPVTTPNKNLEKLTPKTFVIEIPAPKTNTETQAPPPPEPEPVWLPSQELLGEFSLRVQLAIENSKLTSAKMTEVTKLFNEVKAEIQRPSPDWNKVTGLLKKSLDFGLWIAPDIIKLAAIYYQAKVPANPPKKKPKEVEIVVKNEVQNEISQGENK